MNWDKVGNWLSENATGILGVVGAVATGGSSAGIAAAASMIMKATNENTPEAALAALKANPETLLELERLANAEEADIRSHHREMLQMQLEDGQKAHEQQQETIRTGDTSQDEYVRHTRPKMARQSWYGTIAFCLAITVAVLLDKKPSVELILTIGTLISSPALAYMGFRTLDKRGIQIKNLLKKN